MKTLSILICSLCLSFSFGAEISLPEGERELKALLQTHKQQVVELREKQKAEVDALVANKPKLQALIERIRAKRVEHRENVRERRGERRGDRRENRRERRN